VLVESSKTPLMAFVSNISILVLNKLLTFLVDGIIGEMCKLVGFDILGVVFFTGKPDQALIEDVDAPWVHACHQDIQPDI
jgi:hypothetical protein